MNIKLSTQVLFLAASAVLVSAASPARAQSSWDQCTDGTPVVRCETYDCPLGDTNKDGSCTLDDNNARLTDVRNDSFCANPLSGCGEVRYYPANSPSSCLVRVEEVGNNCDLFSVSTPNFTPAPSPTPVSIASPSPTAAANALVCTSLTASPNAGNNPLRTTFTANVAGNLNNLSVYEFSIKGPNNSNEGTIEQKGNTLLQTLTKTGRYTVQVVAVAKDGTRITSNACRTTVEVLSANDTLPETGSEALVGVTLVLMGVAGVYMYEKFRFI